MIQTKTEGFVASRPTLKETLKEILQEHMPETQIYMKKGRASENELIKANICKDTSDKGLLSTVYKKLLKLDNEPMNNPISKCAKDLNRHHTKEDKQMANKHMKNFQHVIRKIQIKTTR